MYEARIDLAELPTGVCAVAARLRELGGRAWLVGGTVRDLLLGLPPRDFDLATDLQPRDVAAGLANVDAKDARFGTCRLESEGLPLTITTLRAETGYADHRRPDHVRFVTDPSADAIRRDYRVNAIYLDMQDGELLDPCGGLADLRQRTLATIGDPVTRFTEDPLRILRGVRFAAGAGLEPDGPWWAAAAQTAPLLRTLSAERVFAELTQAFTRRGRGRALRLLVECGAAAVLLPEVAAMDGVTQPPEYHPEGDVLTHVCLVLDHVPTDHPVLAWSAVLHDVGKPPTWTQGPDRIRFHGHDTLSATMADAVLQRLHASTALRSAVVDVCLQHIRFASLPAMRPVRAERWMRAPGFADHLAFHRADCLGSHGDLSIHEFASRALAALGPERTPLIVASDVLALGIAPGPRVGHLMRAMQQRADDAEPPLTREAALVLLRDMVRNEDQGQGHPAR